MERSPEADSITADSGWPFVCRSPLLVLLLAVTLSVPFWILGAVVPTPADSPVPLPLSALQFLAPGLAAGLLVFRDGGVPGLRRFLRDAVRLRGLRSRGSVAVIVAVMPAIYGSAYLVMWLTGQPLPDPVIAWTSIPILIWLFLVTGFFEEIGWTGYALDPLRARWGAATAAFVIGVVWAGVHVIPDIQGGHDVAWIVFHRTAAIALRFLIVWAYLANGSSLPAAVIVHAMDNVSWMLFPNGGSHYDPVFIAPISALLAVVLVLRNRARPAWQAA